MAKFMFACFHMDRKIPSYSWRTRRHSPGQSCLTSLRPKFARSTHNLLKTCNRSSAFDEGNVNLLSKHFKGHIRGRTFLNCGWSCTFMGLILSLYSRHNVKYEYVLPPVFRGKYLTRSRHNIISGMYLQAIVMSRDSVPTSSWSAESYLKLLSNKTLHDLLNSAIPPSCFSSRITSTSFTSVVTLIIYILFFKNMYWTGKLLSYRKRTVTWRGYLLAVRADRGPLTITTTRQGQPQWNEVNIWN